MFRRKGKAQKGIDQRPFGMLIGANEECAFLGGFAQLGPDVLTSSDDDASIDGDALAISVDLSSEVIEVHLALLERRSDELSDFGCRGCEFSIDIQFGVGWDFDGQIRRRVGNRGLGLVVVRRRLSWLIC